MNGLIEMPERVYLAAGYTDLRLGIDGLTSIIEYGYKLDSKQNSLFLFCGRRADRMKGILWQKDGYVLLYKRLDNGRFKWPRNTSELQEITPRQLNWLLDGLTITQKTSIKYC